MAVLPVWLLLLGTAPRKSEEKNEKGVTLFREKVQWRHMPRSQETADHGLTLSSHTRDISMASSSSSPQDCSCWWTWALR
jgi:hypothetical protein